MVAIKRGQDGNEISDGFMQGKGLGRNSIVQGRCYSVQDRMAGLMGYDIPRLTGVDHLVGIVRTVEEENRRLCKSRS